MTDEVCLAIRGGLDPILDRFEWNDATHWHNSGLWDYEIAPDGEYRRVLNVPYAAELRCSEATVQATLGGLAGAVAQRPRRDTRREKQQKQSR
jgi:hypothetical protein